MLQNLREHVQGWIAGVIAGVLCLAFALWGVEYYVTNAPAQTIIVKVNGDEITQSQFDVLYNRAHQIQPSDSAENEAQIKTHLLNGLIQQSVLTHAARQAGYVISSAQVGVTLQQMPDFQRNGQFSYELFQRTLSNLPYTPDSFLKEIGQGLLIQQLQRSLIESNFVLTDDLNRYSSLLNEKRTFGYMLIPPTPFLATAAVTDQEIEAYYKANSKRFATSEQISLQYLILSKEEANKKIKVSEEDLHRFYEENIAVKNSEMADFSKVRAQIEKNVRQQKTDQWIADQSDKLANLTYTHSDTLKPAATVLNLSIQTTPFFTPQGEKTGLVANPKILKAALSDNVLKQNNNSDVINLDDHTAVVIRLGSYKPAAVKPLSEVRPDIQKILKQQSAQKAAAALGESIVQDLQKGVSPQALAVKNKLIWVQKTAVGREAKDIPPHILTLAFDQPAPGSDKKPIIKGQVLPDSNYALIAINAVIEGAPTAIHAADPLSEKMEHSFDILDYHLYLKEQIRLAKIKIEKQ